MNELHKEIAKVVNRVKIAQQQFAKSDQKAVDTAVTAVAWAGYKEENAEYLAQLAYEQSGLGNAADKFTKIRRKTMGTLHDLKGAKSVGVIEVDKEKGLTKIGKPMGIIAAVLPATNPAATIINNIMISIKGRNGIILAPHPRGEKACSEAVRLVHEELRKLHVPTDLVQWVSTRGENKAAGKARAQELMKQVNFVLATTGPGNVDLAYSSGTPALGVGVGNAPVILDETADLETAVPQIIASKTFDYATSCSSENALVIHSSIYDAALNRLQAQGGYLVSTGEKEELEQVMWPNGHLSRTVVAQSPQRIAEQANLESSAKEAKFLIVEETGFGEAFKFSGEKLSVVLTVYKYHQFDEALDYVTGILNYMGLGHSCGIHSSNPENIQQLAQIADVSTVLVNQPHCYNNGGSFNNGLDFTLSMGAGTWGKNSSCDNITYKHLLNITTLAEPIADQTPTEDELWGDYLAVYG